MIFELIDKKFYLILSNFNDKKIKNVISSNEEYVTKVLDVSKFKDVKDHSLNAYMNMIYFFN